VLTIRAVEKKDEALVSGLLDGLWGSRSVVSRGKFFDAAKLPGFIACEGDEVVGLLTFRIHDGECEVVTLDALAPGKGIGSQLLKEAFGEARSRGCHKFCLITTNDNLDALAFYQKRGLRMIAIHQDAVSFARKLKPQIPLVAPNGIPIRDEIEFEIEL
jgi:GNAT superfamily N-acetyltransferase